MFRQPRIISYLIPFFCRIMDKWGCKSLTRIDLSTNDKKNETIRRVTSNLGGKIRAKENKKAKLLLYWLDEWANDVLPFEETFDYGSLISYKRGMVVEANFGFKVGSEQGGLHYALVIENDNAKSSKTVTVIPLGSLKPGKTERDIRDNEVFLGKGIFKDEIKKLKHKIKQLEKEISSLTTIDEEKQKLLEKYNKKLIKYQKGTIALVGQICALSKMRIRTPKRAGDELHSFMLTKTKLTLIDRKLKNMYTKPRLKK